MKKRTTEKKNPSEKATAEKNGLSDELKNSGIPPEAEQEIIDLLFRENCASSDEMADILERYGVSGDPAALQRAFLKSRVQRIMSRFRDGEGKRQVLAGKDGIYYLVPLCNDLEALDKIEQRLQHQSAGLHHSSDLVTRRTLALREMLDNLKASYRRKTNRETPAP